MLSVVQHVLWVLPAALQALIAIVMLWRKLPRQLPWFFSYTVFHCVRAAVLWEIHVLTMPRAYFWTYWIGEAVSAALGFMVIYELYSHVLDRYAAIHRLGIMLFRWSALVLISLSFLTAFTIPAEDIPIASIVLTAERSVRIIQFGLLAFLFSFASFLRLTLKHYVFGIAAGFFLAVGTELAVVAIRAYGGGQDNMAFALLKSAAYNCAVAIWAAYILRPELAVQPVLTVPKDTLSEWNAALAELIAR